jgi:(5-formylfuran-3-yl)methyl phosphate synthase
MAELLVSVRSLREAKTALAGGAAIIDIKEPTQGSLGRAADSTIAAIVEFVNHRVPVSAALGELAKTPEPFPGQGLSYVKWGLAGCGPVWRQKLEQAGRRQHTWDPLCQIVAVAYADWRLAQAPSPAEVLQFVGQVGWQTMLIDTWCKERGTLLDWLALTDVEQICQECRNANVRVALAGSLGPKEIETLRSAQPDLFAVRRAVCRQSNRRGRIDPVKVRRLVRGVSSELVSVSGEW